VQFKTLPFSTWKAIRRIPIGGVSRCRPRLWLTVRIQLRELPLEVIRPHRWSLTIGDLDVANNDVAY
jgi:hypothetical protein